uniref:Uncharacterized protein n=1 Tax=Romanomermis culicivorax TaxID=13658 RepID=A0A915IS09_ROMCU
MEKAETQYFNRDNSKPGLPAYGTHISTDHGDIYNTPNELLARLELRTIGQKLSIGQLGVMAPKKSDWFLKI